MRGFRALKALERFFGDSLLDIFDLGLAAGRCVVVFAVAGGDDLAGTVHKGEERWDGEDGVIGGHGGIEGW